MAGPDSKRLYLSIIAQSLDDIKSERAYWNKNFVSITPSGTGIKYTTIQAAMLLKKLQVVKFLVRHPAIDLTVKATDGRSTLMIAAQSSLPVPLLQKLLEKYDLKTINECDPTGKTALDLAEPGSETYQFLESVGCQTKAARDACLQGFFGSAGKNVVHQRVRTKSEAAGGKSSSCPPAESDRGKPEGETRSSHSVESDPVRGGRSAGGGSSGDRYDDGINEDDEADWDEEESPWHFFTDPEDLLRVLENYVNTWGDEGEDGELCQEWIAYVKKKMKKNAAAEAISKWNELVLSTHGKENVSEYKSERRRDAPHMTSRQTNSTEGDTLKKAEGDANANGCTDTTKDENKGSRSASLLGKKTEEEARDDSANLEDRHEAKGAAGGTPVATPVAVPESLREFFNPQELPETSSDSLQPKHVPEGDRRRTLCVWIDKADARERFAEVLPGGGGGGTRRRHKKGGKT